MKLLPIPRTRITTQPLNSGVVMRVVVALRVLLSPISG